MSAPAEGPPPMPRWVVWLGLGAVAVVLVFAAIHLLGGGVPRHGP